MLAVKPVLHKHNGSKKNKTSLNIYLYLVEKITKYNSESTS